MKTDIYYQAMLARDHRFDGKFFIGVKTTGIYCRPICPAKPKRENVEFFLNHLAAEKAGYRPCMRCRPESAPFSPAWIGTSAIVKRAIKILHERETMEFNEDEFAELFGVSARHLRRLFLEEIGKTPKQLSFENRLNLSRKLVTETHLSMTEIAFASGFNSIRRFNDAFKERFSKSPTEMRKYRGKKTEGLKVSLSYRPPFHYQSLLHFYKSHQMGALERIEEGKYIRLIHKDKRSGFVIVSNDEKNSRLVVEIDFPDTSIIHAAISRVRNMFDLNSDPVMISNALEIDPQVKKMLMQYPGVRVPSGWDAFEVAISTILGQLVSIERGRALVNDLIKIAGKESGIMGEEGPIKLFPTPKALTEVDLEALKTTRVRRQTLIDFSKAILDGQISLEPTQDVESFTKKLTAIKGIGRWTADYMALKVLRHTDAFPSTDLILKRAMDHHSAKKLVLMSPWRGYVATLFWLHYSGSLKKTSIG